MNTDSKRLSPEVQAVVEVIDRIIQLLRARYPDQLETSFTGFRFTADDFTKLDLTERHTPSVLYIRVCAQSRSRTTLYELFASSDDPRDRKNLALGGHEVEALQITFQPCSEAVAQTLQFGIICKLFAPEMFTEEMSGVLHGLSKHELFRSVTVMDDGPGSHMTFLSKGEVVPFPHKVSA